MVIFKKFGTIYKVYYENGVYLGDIYMEIDGDFVFWPDYQKKGFWAWPVLEEITNKLKDLNL